MMEAMIKSYETSKNNKQTQDDHLAVHGANIPTARRAQVRLGNLSQETFEEMCVINYNFEVAYRDAGPPSMRPGRSSCVC